MRERDREKRRFQGKAQTHSFALHKHTIVY